MTQSAAPPGRLRAVLVIVATLATIGFNFLAAGGWINGITPEEVSAKYPTPVTPADYAFAIWSLIYAGLIAFSIYQVLPSNLEKFRGVRTFFILSSALNCGWIYFWHHDQIVVCFILISLLAITLFFINLYLKKTNSSGDYWLVKAPFNIYFGWVTAATLVNFAVMLVYLKMEATGGLAVILIALATAVGLLVRFKLSNYLCPLAIAWALTGIAVKQSGNTAIVVAAAVGVVALLIATLSFVVNLPSHTTRPAAQ